jgi:hypothetical protein
MHYERTSTRSSGENRGFESAQNLLLAANMCVRGIYVDDPGGFGCGHLRCVEDLVQPTGAPAIRRSIARFVQLVVHVGMTADRSQRYVAEVARVLASTNGTSSGFIRTVAR